MLVAEPNGVVPFKVRVAAVLPVVSNTCVPLPKVMLLPTAKLALLVSSAVPAAMVTLPVPKGPETRGPPPVVGLLATFTINPPPPLGTVTPPPKVLAPLNISRPAPVLLIAAVGPVMTELIVKPGAIVL